MKEDISIPLVWPNQPINTGSSGAVTGIGHAGIIMIDGDSGNTTFVEYGRYDSDFDGSPLAGGGAIRFVSLGNTPTQGGTITINQLEGLLNDVDSLSSYDRGAVLGSVFIGDTDGFEAGTEFIKDVSNEFLGNYSVNPLYPMHCYTFTVAVGNEMGTWQDWADC